MLSSATPNTKRSTKSVRSGRSHNMTASSLALPTMDSKMSILEKYEKGLMELQGSEDNNNNQNEDPNNNNKANSHES